MDDGNDLFTISEMLEMKKLYEEKGEGALVPEFCKEIASTFSLSSYRVGKSAVTWEQVQTWFAQNYEETQPEPTQSPMPIDMLVGDLPDNITLPKPKPLDMLVDDLPDNIPVPPKPKPVNMLVEDVPGNTIPEPTGINMLVDDVPDNITVAEPKVWKTGAKAADLSELIFEAKSTRDNAWFDVGTFLNYRVVSSGHLEVRVRFAGFDYGHDEWVDLKTCVRERSIPLEPSECHKVSVGDLILCYRERSEQSLYYDAHVLEIRRQKHEPDCCECIFVVRYDLDDVQEKVGLEWICCRPGSGASGSGSSSQETQLPPKSIFY